MIRSQGEVTQLTSLSVKFYLNVAPVKLILTELIFQFLYFKTVF